MVLSMERWNGKVAVVTGASAGMGTAIAEHLVKHGMKVIGLARRVQLIEGNAKKLSAEKGELHGLKVDMARQEEITNAFKIIEEKFGPVHVLVNNAGFIEETSLADGDFEIWKKTFDVNVLGLCVATREAIRSMKRHDVDGHILHINSITGHFPMYCSGFNVAAASKYAVTALTHDLTEELKEAGSKIKVTSLSPGMVDTEASRRIFGEEVDTGPSLKGEDVADAAIYILSTPSHVQIQTLMIRPVGAYF